MDTVACVGNEETLESCGHNGWGVHDCSHSEDVSIACTIGACLCNIPLPSARQHPRYGDCLEFKREYYQNCFVLGCVTRCLQSAAHLCEQFLQVQQIWFVTLGPLHHA